MTELTDKTRLLADPFPPEDIEWRVSTTRSLGGGEGEATILAYITARAVQERLDKVFGVDGWEDEYKFIQRQDGKLGVVCELTTTWTREDWGSDDDGNRKLIHSYQDKITKSDGAPETDFEAFKGGISDALKRAASKYGIGRYLYNLPQTKVRVSQSFKGHPNARFLYAKDKYGKDDIKGFWVPPALTREFLPAGYNPGEQAAPPVGSQVLGAEEYSAPAHTSSKPSGGAGQKARPSGGSSWAWDDAAVKYIIPYNSMTEDMKIALKQGGARFRGKKNNPQDVGADNGWYAMMEIERDDLRPYVIQLKKNITTTNEPQGLTDDSDELPW